MVISLIRNLPAPVLLAILALAAAIVTVTMVLATAHGAHGGMLAASAHTHYWD